MKKSIVVCRSIAILALVLMCSCAQCAVKYKAHRSPITKKSSVSVAQTINAPSFALPADAVLLSEVNLSESDLLDMLKKSIPKLDKLCISIPDAEQVLKNVKFDQLYDCIKGLKAVRIDSFKMKNIDVTSKDARPSIDGTYAFFDRQVNRSQGWNRIFYKTDVPGEDVIAVYAKGHNFLGVVISSKTNKNIAFGTAGFVDMPKLIDWGVNIASNVLKNAGDEDHTSTKNGKKPAAVTTDKQTPQSGK